MVKMTCVCKKGLTSLHRVATNSYTNNLVFFQFLFGLTHDPDLEGLVGFGKHDVGSHSHGRVVPRHHSRVSASE